MTTTSEKPMDMEFKLKAALKCSANLEGSVNQSDIDELVASCNIGVLKRGAPPGCGAEIVKWNVAEDKIELKIVSDRFVRAHDALLRLKKEFGKLLGKHSIGIRGVIINDYKITLEWVGGEWFKGEQLLNLRKLPTVVGASQSEGKRAK